MRSGLLVVLALGAVGGCKKQERATPGAAVDAAVLVAPDAAVAGDAAVASDDGGIVGSRPEDAIDLSQFGGIPPAELRLGGHDPAAARVRFELPEGATGADQQTIRREVRRLRRSMTHCYDQQLLAKPDLKGTVTVTFTVGSDGTVSEAKGRGVDQEVARCMAAFIGAMTLPKPAGGKPLRITQTIKVSPTAP